LLSCSHRSIVTTPQCCVAGLLRSERPFVEAGYRILFWVILGLNFSKGSKQMSHFAHDWTGIPNFNLTGLK
jgi:hypothetical protein